MDSAMYYFDTLPLRRQPQPLESFTSYLTRLAEANGKNRYSQLNPFFEEYRSISRFVSFNRWFCRLVRPWFCRGLSLREKPVHRIFGCSGREQP